jgi:hypothetical protein
MKDGLQGHCRDCQADAYRSRRETEGHLVRPANVPEGYKFCRGCESARPFADFAGRTGRRAQATFRCNDCMRQDDRERHLRRTYAMTEADAAEMLAHQGGLCAICQSAPAIHIDHDHRTGAVRGMLCFRCNAALGQLGDSPDVLVRAARYLLTAAEERVPFEVVWTERLAQVVEYDGSAS